MLTATQPGRLITLVRRGSRRTCVLLPGAGGGLGYYLRLAEFLGRTGNVYGIRASGLVAGEEPESRVGDMADSALRALDDAGIEPDLVLGWSMGGVIGWEMCVRLAERGVRPDLALLDSSPLPRAESADSTNWLLDKVGGMLGPRPDKENAARLKRVLMGQLSAVAEYRVDRSYGGRVLLVTCAGPEATRELTVANWRNLAPRLREQHLDVDHYEVFRPDNLPALRDSLTPFVTPEPWSLPL
ncbi:Thioesterase domain-containing protein [Amycolatopsis marina]|uniref:Thioesterase domain-containing protein n=1 Tax=Amycolatopsis marina TaxID=490629 RepID=A0A1I0YKD0_9PSEU|nr:alpha/beta fold hydrolase [Amycolatopsis marina]SFB13849.1 Thioesterase domain-containing protein [Amycolatopsis marina]